MDKSAEIQRNQTMEDKIKAISAKFEVAESIVCEDVEVLDEKVSEISTNRTEYHPADVMSVEVMAEDFKFSRDSLKETIRYGRQVLEAATQELLMGDDKASNTMAFAELTSSVINGIKVYSSIYRDFSITLLNIKKVIKEEAPASVTNNLNVAPISTIDLIQQLKDMDD